MTLIFLVGVSSAADWQVSVGDDLANVLSQVSDGDRVFFDPGSFPDDVFIDNLDNVEFIGSGSDPVTGTVFDGGVGTGVWYILDSENVTVSHLAIDGRNTLRGIAVENSDDIVLDDVTILRGIGSPRGGGMWVGQMSSVTVANAHFENNISIGRGGALWSLGDVTVTGSTFVGNLVQPEKDIAIGAGIYCEALCTVMDSHFEGGLASGGGGIYFYGADIVVLRNTFCNNTAILPFGDGAGLMTGSSSGRIANNIFLGNDSTEEGGGMYLDNSVMEVTNNTFVGNTSVEWGAAFYQQGKTADVTMVNNLVMDNTTSLEPAAAVHIAQGASAIGYNLFWDNTSTDVFSSANPIHSIIADPGIPSFAGNCDLDVRPGPASPAIDAGDPSILDADGTVSDIGATGGPDALPPPPIDPPDTGTGGSGGTPTDTGEPPGSTTDTDDETPDDLVDTGDPIPSLTIDDRILPRGWHCSSLPASSSWWLGLGLLLVGGRRRPRASVPRG